MKRLEQGIGEVKTISEIYEESTIKKVVDAKFEFGIDSQEFKTAQLEHLVQSAKREAEYQIRKAANQAWLYERGY